MFIYSRTHAHVGIAYHCCSLHLTGSMYDARTAFFCSPQYQSMLKPSTAAKCPSMLFNALVALAALNSCSEGLRLTIRLYSIWLIEAFIMCDDPLSPTL